MIHIMKASAGSGKTYNLAATYIRLLLESGDPYAYRHILAVTITNMATSEMKTRILKELALKAGEDARAQKLLVNILHDYSAFSISTIDKFFQQTLKAFSREIGQFASYQVELDRKSLIHEAIDRILDTIGEKDRDFLEWVCSIARENIAQGRKFNTDTHLYAAAESLKSGEFSTLSERYGINASADFSKERLRKIRKACDDVIDNFREQLANADSAYLAGFDKGKKIIPPTKTYLKKVPALSPIFGLPYKEYLTAWLIRERSTSLGVARELENEFNALLKEKNVLSLDDSNTILKGIIDGCDAPFIYEKLGVRYEHFLLDEFQDTSTIQWENFLPLLKESNANGHENLIVGDVKQSIYRWRSSDWNLLATKLVQQFPDSHTTYLDNNWRSTAAVVDFNNGFYSFAARKLDEVIGERGGGMSIKSLYEDVSQGKKTKDRQRGKVEVSFIDKEEMLSAIESSVRYALDAGARPSDIAILVRGHEEGGELAGHLISSGIRVISDDSLNLLSSMTVRRLISLLNCIDRPQDSINTYLAESLDIDFPKEYHSLTDLCECLLRGLRKADAQGFDAETLYIQTFMDILQDWTAVNGNNLKLFLDYIKDSDARISSPADPNAVTVMTIHKSKGLEFPYVIFPYAQKVTLYKHSEHWCRPDLEVSRLNGKAEGIYPVDLTNEIGNSYFESSLLREQKLQAVDNLNIFYVATTRASSCLHIISAMPSAKLQTAVDNGKDAEYKSMSDILYAYCKKYGFRFGEDYDFDKMERKNDAGISDFPAVFRSIGIGGRLGASADASDFFGENGYTGASASARLSGIALHEILSLVLTPSDLPSAVKEAVRKGPVSEAEGIEAQKLLAERITSHPEWFNAANPSTDISNETSVYDEYGNLHRPDRVIVRGNEAVIVDYKFGEKMPGHKKQVSEYARLYRALGYDNVQAFLWYVQEDEIERVDSI